MEIDNHVPSLVHLREFVRARASSRPTHVDLDRRQVTAPAENRIFAFAYERFLTGVISFVNEGDREALQRVASEANDRMRPSYEDCAKGMARILLALMPVGVRRRQRNVVVLDRDGYELVSLRVHLMFELPSGTIGAFMHFPEHRLTDAELMMMDTAVALATRQIDSSAEPAIIMVRAGTVRLIDSSLALAPGRLAVLRSESAAYRTAWAEAA